MMRILLFLATNLAVVLIASITLSLFGLRPMGLISTSISC